MNLAAIARKGTQIAARVRKAPVRESDIQAAIIAYLAAVAPGVLVWAVPNAARRNAGGRAGNAVPGLRKGVYDLSLVLPDGRFAAIEVKTDTGIPSEAQMDFERELGFRNVPTCLARSIDDVRAFLSSIGIETREAA
jgi:hypothetical protein